MCLSLNHTGELVGNDYDDPYAGRIVVGSIPILGFDKDVLQAIAPHTHP